MIGNMHIKKTPLYRKAYPRIPWNIRLIMAALFTVAPVWVMGDAQNKPYEQEFVITAYYSPLPRQCCYVKGGERADKILNGEGARGADGTEVYPGMIAAPPSYAFGTVVLLPTIGRFTVHDRGGAIQEQGAVHRLDIWAGAGEEGLARALAFGVRRIKGTVYPLGSAQPSEKVSLDHLPAPLDRLEPFLITGNNLTSVSAIRGDVSYSVEMLQQKLHDLGYLSALPNGSFGPATEEALRAFNNDYFIGEEPSDRLSLRSAATLMAARARSGAALPLAKTIDRNSSASDVMSAQRMLRFFGFYTGRTDGVYNDHLKESILRFQQVKGLVGTAEDAGAGRIGPLTRNKIAEAWNRRLVTTKARRILALARVDTALDARGSTIDRFLSLGDSGEDVTRLQELLADRGLFPAEKINGNFGQLTQEAVLKYQLEKKLVPDARSEGAGDVGPQTLLALRSDERMALYRMVRAQGWRAL